MATTLKGVKQIGSATLKGGNGEFTYTETYDYVVISDNKEEAFFDVITTSGLPRVFMDSIGSLRCVSKSAKKDPKSPYVWHVTCEFSIDSTGQQTAADPNPTTWVPVWTGSIETYDEVLYMDKSSTPKPYVNSARCKFPEPLVAKKPIVVCPFTQYEASSTTVATILSRNEVTNNATYRGFAVDTLKLNVKSFTYGFYFGYSCVKIDYVVAYKPDDWLDKPLDMGYEYYPTAGASTRILSEKIVALNSDGTKKLDSADPVVNKTFRNCAQISFSFLRA